ncbi:MAG: DinB family protein [Chloroflexi bacterium]|nr:DinB family protein [Chloroflexota bacterium]
MPITTLLFDLDDTLLGNPLETFVPQYLKSLSESLADLVPPQTLLDELLAGTQAMFANADPRRTLAQAFGQQFYRAVSVPVDQFSTRVEQFYGNTFGDLRPLTKQLAVARDVIQWATGSGFKVGIATNAIFPRTAILQRLAWAGVSADEFPYALLTTFEFMHFAKPRPEYFAETLAWLDCRPEETMMVGNDWVQDIASAEAAGLNTFWIADRAARPPANAAPAHPAAQGSLADFLAWARDSESLASVAPRPATPRAARAHQAASLAVMMQLAQGLTAEQWLRRPDDRSWSVTEIACHLRDVEIEVNLPRLRRVLKVSNPFISAVDSDLWALSRDYQSQSGLQALAGFAEARQKTLDLLDSLSAEEWQRKLRHAIFGPSTVQDLVTFTNEHDRLHLRQTRENLASEVGNRKSEVRGQTPTSNI